MAIETANTFIIHLMAGSYEEADKVLQGDPLVASGLISYELGQFFPAD